jgi:hypothetical protein
MEHRRLMIGDSLAVRRAKGQDSDGAQKKAASRRDAACGMCQKVGLPAVSATAAAAIPVAMSAAAAAAAISAATTAAAATVTTAAAATAAATLIVSFIYTNLSTTEIVSIEIVNCFQSFIIIGHLNEAKPSGLIAKLVSNNRCRSDLAYR